MFESGGDEVNGMAITQATFNWLGEGLTEEENVRVRDRLKDPEDDLDIDQLSDVILKLSERVAARPTT